MLEMFDTLAIRCSLILCFYFVCLLRIVRKSEGSTSKRRKEEGNQLWLLVQVAEKPVAAPAAQVPSSFMQFDY